MFYESLNEQNRMCELCTFPNPVTYVTVHAATLYHTTHFIPHVLWGQKDKLLVWLLPSQLQHHPHTDPSIHHVLHIRTLRLTLLYRDH